MAHSRLVAMAAQASNNLCIMSSAPDLKPKDMTSHLNEIAKSRQESAIKALYKYFQVPGIANLAGGFPNPGYFPFETFEAAVAKHDRLGLDMAKKFHGIDDGAEKAGLLSSWFSHSNAARDHGVGSTEESEAFEHIVVPKVSDDNAAPTERIDLADVLQYGQASGLAPLQKFIKEFSLKHLHGGRIPYSDPAPEVLLTCGSTDGFAKVMGMVATKGDWMLVEEYCYMNAVNTALPFGVGVVPVKVDDGGVCVEGPGGLREILRDWNWGKGRRPHFMYTVPTGQNPIGVTTEMDRKREIYTLCEDYDILIIEDDPYWFLQYTKFSHPSATETEMEIEIDIQDEKYPFLEALTPSYLTIDISGRVIRLDTFSKTIAPGCRLGWITAQPMLIDRLYKATEAGTAQPSGFTQALVAKLLIETWGMDGWIRWLEGLRNVYEKRMKTMVSTLAAHSEIISESEEDGMLVVNKVNTYHFTEPAGGMFVWVTVNVGDHPAFREYTSSPIGKTKFQFMDAMWSFIAESFKSLPAPGWIFSPTEKQRRECTAFRLCFAALEGGEIESATEKFGKGVQEFWRLRAREIAVFGERADAGKGGWRVRGMC